MTLALLALAHASPGAAALAAISDGDHAWWTGDRGAAVASWQRALAAAEAPEDDAVEVMARVRLLQLTGNVAPFVHERKLQVALEQCSPTEPWCAIAGADVELFMPAFTGADPRRVPSLLAGSPLQGPAAARVAVATGDTQALAALAIVALDGMGRGILETGRRSAMNPGTWVLGVGVGGAPGAGLAVLVRFVHPDLAWSQHRLELVASADTRGGFSVVSGLRARGGLPTAYGLSGGRIVADLWTGDHAVAWSLGTTRAYAAITPRWGGVGLTLGASGRVDVTSEVWPVAGPFATISLGEGDVFRVSADTAFGAYTHLALGADWSARQPLAGGTLALHAAVTHVPTDSPFWRLPSAGGTDVLRGLPAGRFRVSTLGVGQFEYRHVLIGPLYGAAFVDGAWADGAHVTVGGGLRVVLPPDRENVTRLDVGVGPEGWGLVAAWGEAF